MKTERDSFRSCKVLILQQHSQLQLQLSREQKHIPMPTTIVTILRRTGQCLLHKNGIAVTANALADITIECTMGHKSHDPCSHKKYMEAGVMTFVVHCTCNFSADRAYFQQPMLTLAVAAKKLARTTK